MFRILASILFLANSHHLTTKNNTVLNHTEDLCEENAPNLPDFEGTFSATTVLRQLILVTLGAGY
jgi:hypothetical protein